MDWMDLCLSSFSKADVKDISLVAAKKLLKLSVKKKKKKALQANQAPNSGNIFCFSFWNIKDGTEI